MDQIWTSKKINNNTIKSQGENRMRNILILTVITGILLFVIGCETTKPDPTVDSVVVSPNSV